MLSKTAPLLLIADTDKAIRRLLRYSARAEGYQCREVASLIDTADTLSRQRPDVLLLDLGFGEAACTGLIASLRQWGNLPILILSAENNEALKVRVLDAGADDYITKPFSIEELMARIRVALRHRVRSVSTPDYTTGEITIDWARRLVKRHGAVIHLTPIEYSILEALAGHPGKIVTHKQLMKQVWGVSRDDCPQFLRVHISNLRCKLESDTAHPEYVETIPGIGYRFNEPRQITAVYPTIDHPQLQAAK
jgi:two-component system, OmpR family, KDP operon response regulator KdpE